MKRILYSLVFLFSLIAIANCDGGGGGGGGTTPGQDTVAGEDTTALGEDTTEPGEDTTEPGEDTTEPGEDTTEPGEDTTEPGEDTTEPVGVEVEVTAADGGTVATEGGEASVEIPAGALAEDTTITIQVEAASGEAKSSIFDFGPDGTQFSAPVTLSIALDGAPGEGEKAVLAWQDGEDWIEVAGSALADGQVTGQVDHFTKFTVIFTGDELVIISDCSEAFDDFVACGGDIVGTWTIEEMCIEFEEGQGGDNPFQGTCPEAVMIVEQTMTGTVNFDGTTQTTTLEEWVMESTLTYPQSCLTALEIPDCETFMAMAADAGVDFPCEPGEDGCTCHEIKTGEIGMEPIVSPYTIVDNAIISEDQEGQETVSPYCVQGDTLISKPEPKPEEPNQFWILKKQ